MKKIILILIAMSVIAGSCRYKEGPVISFRSVHDRLVGTWAVTGYTSDGIDSLQYYNDSCGCKIVFPQPNNADMNTEIGFLNCFKSDIYAKGSYNFKKNKKIMEVFCEPPLSAYNFFGNRYVKVAPMLMNIEWYIFRLTNDDFKISANANGHAYSVIFKKIN